MTPLESPSDAQPAWLPQLVALRREQPTAAAATLALSLDPAGTGHPTGWDIKQWLPVVDQQINGENPSESESSP